MCLLYPDLLKNSVAEITYDDLHRLGVKGLLLDVDNTLTTHDSQRLEEKVSEWLEMMKRMEIGLTIVSNASERRVAPFARRIELEFVSRAGKPLPFGFIRGAKRLGLPLKQCAVVGDQSFTDVLGANLAGIPCIQVLPILLEKDKPFMMFKRWLERYIIKAHRKKQLKGKSGD